MAEKTIEELRAEKEAKEDPAAEEGTELPGVDAAEPEGESGEA